MASVRGGEKFAAALKAISEKASKAKLVRVGFLENATYPDGTPVAMVAAIQEFGAPARNIPPRPFFRGMIAKHKSEWPDAIAAQLKATDYDVAQTLARVGGGVKGQLQQEIGDFAGVPLAPSTVKRKGADKQLIDSGHMWNSVDYEIE